MSIKYRGSTLPPGPSSSPLVQGMRFLWRPTTWLDACARRFGDPLTLRLPVGPPMAVFSQPNAVRQIFTADDDGLRAGEAFAPLAPLLGRSSVLLLDGARHATVRRMMLPPFHGARLLAWGDTIRTVAARAVEEWPVGRPFRLRDAMQAITLEVILRAVFGLADERHRTLVRERLEGLVRAARNPALLWPAAQRNLGRWSPWGRFVRLRRSIDEVLFAELAARRAAESDARGDVLSLLLAARDEAGGTLADREIRDQMLTLFLAGHETTATALAWAVHHLISHPHVLARLRAELAAGPAEPLGVGRLEYLAAVVDETLRLTPVLDDVSRVLVHPARIGGWSLPSGVAVAASIYLTHRRPDVWPDPLRFRPERFVGSRPSPYAFLPFGGGGRRCVGLAFALYEMKLVLAEIVSRMDLRHAPGHRPRTVRRAITLAPSGGMPVVATRRTI